VKAQARREACNFIHRTYPPGSNQHHVAFEIFARGDYFELVSDGKAFARLDKAFCSEARRLIGLEVRFQACLERKRLEEAIRPSRLYADGIVTFSVDVNVKSLMNHADKVGNILLSSGIFLQCPTQNPAGETYYNPQILQIEGFHEKPDDIMIEADDAQIPVVIPDRPTQSNLKPSLNSQDHVEQILDSLSHTNILQEIRTDTSRIKSKLMKQVAPSSSREMYTDSYHRHQKMALDFIAQRESGRPSAELTFWRERRRNGET
jgi:SWI/SNF-related matrix-associated actin-dependent regulator of chromatin subfamily A3